MNILVISFHIPMHDRSGGGKRFHSILGILASEYSVYLHAFDLDGQVELYSQATVDDYRRQLHVLGVNCTSGKRPNLITMLRDMRFDVVLFEHFASALSLLESVRLWQPNAVAIVDSVDVVFQRLFSKARLTQSPDDFRIAEQTKINELDIYNRADVVLAVSPAEKDILKKEIPTLIIETVPLVFPVRPMRDLPRKSRDRLVFIADFQHDANVDGIVYFCNEILPLILGVNGNINLQIVGGYPPDKVKRLAGSNVEVLGYVKDIGKIYENSDIAIAPMRYGGGIKGKIAEAIAFGLPVVTNSISLKGFDLMPGEEILLGDTPNEFSDSVIRLLTDDGLCQKIKYNAWEHIKLNYSEDAVGIKLFGLISKVHEYPIKRLPLNGRIMLKLRYYLERHVLWRFRNELDY